MPGQEPKDQGTTQETNAPDPNQGELDSLLEQAISKTETEEPSAPEEEITIDKLGLTDEQLAAIKKIKQKEIDAVNTHWQQTNSKQHEELGRLRKIENTIYELEQESKNLKAQESEHEFDAEKKAQVMAKRINIDEKAQIERVKLLQAQTMQKVPDFDQLVKDGYMKNAVTEYVASQGSRVDESNISEAYRLLKSNPGLAVTLASNARKEKKIAELSSKNKQIVDGAHNLASKVTTASESNIVTNGITTKQKYTSSDINKMSQAELNALIQRGKKNGVFRN